LKNEINKTDQERKNETHWPFGQSGKGHTDIESIDGKTPPHSLPLPLWERGRACSVLNTGVKGTILIPLEKTKKGNSCEEGKSCINICPSGKIKKFNIGSKDET
jgi:hypothetical protein